MPVRRSAFTLIELLVVVAIIVVLLALLAPALDKAVYQAELAACGANLKALALGPTTYAAENRRSYPYRPTTTHLSKYVYTICQTTDDDLTPRDDRDSLRRGHVSINKNLLDPLSGEVDLERPPSGNRNWVMSNYSLWFGVRYPISAGGGSSIQRLGDRLKWTDSSRGQLRTYRFNVLASDKDAVMPAAATAWSGHPEREAGILSFVRAQEAPDLHIQTFSHWSANGRWDRSPTDLNYAYADGAVVRSQAVTWNDEHMARVPVFNRGDGTGSNEDNTGLWHQLPPE